MSQVLRTGARRCWSWGHRSIFNPFQNKHVSLLFEVSARTESLDARVDELPDQPVKKFHQIFAISSWEILRYLKKKIPIPCTYFLHFCKMVRLELLFEPTTVELHQTGTFWRTLYRNSYMLPRLGLWNDNNYAYNHCCAYHASYYHWWQFCACLIKIYLRILKLFPNIFFIKAQFY